MGIGNLIKSGNIVNTEYAYYKVPKELDVFDNDTDRESVKSYLEQYHLETTKLQPKAEDTQKKLSTIQITADKDIRINLPMDIYDSPDFEISTAPDGTSEVRLTGILELVVK